MSTALIDDRDGFISANIGLVHSCAHRFKGRGIEYDNLLQAGCLGLVKAYDAFDRERGVRFSTYAVPVILGEIKKLFRDGGSVKVSRQLKERAVKVARENDRFINRYGIEPTVSELAELMEMDESDIVDALNCSRSPLSLTAYDDDDDSRTIDIPSNDAEEGITELLSLNRAIETLDETDRKIVKLRFIENKTQSETVAMLGTTQVQVSRKERKLLSRLRKLMCE